MWLEAQSTLSCDASSVLPRTGCKQRAICFFGCVYPYFFLNVNHVGCFGRRKFNGSIIERKVPFLLLKRNAVVFIPSLAEGKALVSHNYGQT